ncbi:hypothetical protein NA57DRAFT_79588 [Rhizodiscina lignyota]|uniref:Uncharacterized protein n=1 Tax=Rhizodiscina lignyota TaxID=1504668 RepID=A0A9P4I9C5_9PEZI|nr:hypothetical protein NA57DRAFT_79588 [Rhizodiscina lignyota]
MAEIQVQGLQLGAISELSGIPKDDQLCMPECRRVLSRYETKTGRSVAERQADLWRVLIADRSQDDIVPTPEAYDRMCQRIEARLDCNGNPKDVPQSLVLKLFDGITDPILREPLVAPFLNAIHRSGSERRFFVSSDGRMGIGPPVMQVGDTVCIFCGGDVPYVLRRHEDKWRFVGEAYVSGAMFGEVIQGLQSNGDLHTALKVFRIQ